jgi:SAM-dependent methyltransferase
METFNLKSYWNNRYVTQPNSAGDGSGAGSEGLEANIKANIINLWIKQFEIKTITEVGCGSGRNLMLYNIPISYTGYDISPRAIEMCNERTRKIQNSLKYFFTNEYDKQDFNADLLLCLDVYYHIPNDDDFELLCKNLFVDFKGKYIIAYTTDTDEQFLPDGTPLANHLRFRKFLDKVNEYGTWEALYIIEGFNTTDGKTMQLPNNKKFFLLRRII